jgi:hypothetical protein
LRNCKIKAGIQQRGLDVPCVSKNGEHQNCRSHYTKYQKEAVFKILMKFKVVEQVHF